MKGVSATALRLLLLAGIVSFAGCSILAPQKDRSRYFVLTSRTDSSAPLSSAMTGGQSLVIGLGPVTIPRYLDRPELVTRVSDSELRISETDRWGEPLQTNVSTVLAQDLSSQLPGVQIVAFPWSRKTPLDYEVAVDFPRLEKTADGQTEVEAVWTIRSANDGKVIQAGTATASAPAAKDQKSATDALSDGIAQVSRKLAQALAAEHERELAQRRQPRS
jgi:uncharacterized protein